MLGSEGDKDDLSLLRLRPTSELYDHVPIIHDLL